MSAVTEPPISDDRLFASSFRSVPDMWLHRCHSTPSGEAMVYRRDGAWQRMTWREADERVRDVANGLLSLGLTAEQRCCILGVTSVPWILADHGILCAGGATTTIFPESPIEDVVYVLHDCEAVVLFCDADQLPRVREARGRLPHVRQIVVLDARSPERDGEIGLEDLEARGRAWGAAHPDAFREAHEAIAPDSLATLMYTSGTTGEPKGVMLTHDAWVYEAQAVDALGLVSPADRQYLFLPLSHSFAKILQVVFVRLGVPTVVDSDTERLLDHMAETRPTWMGAVPRVFEKAYERIVADAKSRGPIATRTFGWALSVGREMSRVRQQRRAPSAILRARFALADRLVFKAIKERFGGRIRFFVSGAAPLPVEVAEFFHACDLLVLEGYGLTESAAGSCFNTPEDFVFGTVGRPIPGTEVRIAEDGEILLRGRGVMKGYHRRPDDTAASLVTDGDGRTWLATGDVGTVLDTGHVQITDRKKEILITSGGKNVAPAHFANRLRARSPYVSQVLVHGDRRPYCVALVAIDEAAVGRWAREAGLSWTSYADLASRPEVHALVGVDVEAVNADLSSHATVRRFALLPEPLTVDNGALTPSLKVKRRVVEERFKERIDALYDHSGTLLGTG